MNKRVACLITGTSSGIGLWTAVELAAAGHHVTASMRDVGRREALDRALRERGVEHLVEILALDVTDDDSVTKAVKNVLARHQRLDVVINNAGIASANFLEAASWDEWRSVLDTNLLGQVRVTNAALPVLRSQGSGRIIFVSSLGGRVPTPGLGVYCASKFALEGYAETLRLELSPFGVDVVLVEPGAFRTNIWNSPFLQETGTETSPYALDKTRLAAFYQNYVEYHLGDPRAVARAITKLATTPRTRLRYLIGRDAFSQALLRLILPWRTYERAARYLVGLR
jgi:NAD(P)-dependent dehydrogenase (short-subunit alcohol dehydrogenase family)